MRILISTESRNSAGGIETYLQALSPLLETAGHEIAWLFGHEQSATNEFGSFRKSQVFTTCPESIVGTRTAIGQWNPEAIFANGLHDPGWDEYLAKKHPTLFFAHGYFGTCISGQKCHSVPKIQACDRPFGAACLLQYLPRRCGGKNPLQMFRDYTREQHRNKNLNLFQHIAVASTHMRSEYVRAGLDQTKVSVLPLFPTMVSPDVASPEPKAFTNRIVMVGRLTRLKGVDLALKSISIASKNLKRDLSLAVIGVGPGEDMLRREAKHWGIKTEFLGWLGAESKNKEVRNSDLLIVPSVWPEPFGLVGIEAGCVGVPAVGFDVGGISDWLVDGVSGEIASAVGDKSNNLSEAIVRALKTNNHWHELRVGAWNTAKQFGHASHLKELCNLLKAIVANRNCTSR